MRPIVEQLESRDVPSTLPWHMPAPTVYPDAPEGKAVFAAQDFINLFPMMPGHGYNRATPLIPTAAVWRLANPSDYLDLSGEWFKLEGVSEPGEGRYTFVDRDGWFALQHRIFGFDEDIPEPWTKWTSAWQADVLASNAQLFPPPAAPPVEPQVEEWDRQLAIALVGMLKE